MPLITVSGFPPGTALLTRLRREIRDAVAAIPELKLTAEQVTVSFPADHLPPDRIELIAAVNGLFQQTERTPEVRQRLAEALRTLLANFAGQFVPGCRKVEVLVNRPFDPADGFGSWAPAA